MPNYFQLHRDGEPVNLNTIDEELCKHFEQPVHPRKYLSDWYGSIGFRLSMGASWDEIRKALVEYPNLVAIADYLEKHFRAVAWTEVGR